MSGTTDIDIGKLSEAINDKMDKDLANTNILTNCIMEYPQNIKLELSDGTLTLKAGSIVVVPNGFEEDGTTRKFDEVTIESDVTSTQTLWGATTYYVIYNPTTNSLQHCATNSTSSGSTQPTIAQGLWWYDTANNYLKTSSSTEFFNSGFGLPIALVTSTDGTTVASIDQTFQSIGYIGSTIFVRKGVRYLIPDGRNDDGSLKNIDYTTKEVKVYTYASTSSIVKCNIYLTSTGGIAAWYYTDEYIADTLPAQEYYHVYKPEANEYWYKDTGDYARAYDCLVGSCRLTNGVISSFRVDTPVKTSSNITVDVIYNGNFTQGSTITLTNNPSEYDFIILERGIQRCLCHASSSFIKCNYFWAGTDSTTAQTTGYAQVYAYDLKLVSGNDFLIAFSFWRDLLDTTNTWNTATNTECRLIGIRLH